MHVVVSSLPAPPPAEPLRGPVVLAYALTALPLAIVGLPLAIYVLPFFAQERGVPLAQLGLVLTAARMGDVFVDPLIGAASDRLRTRFGRRRPWIVAGAPVLMLGTWMLFVPPAGVGPGYLVLWTLVAYVGWSLISVPHAAWGAELSGDYHERSRIAGAREMAAVAGLLLAAVVVGASGGRLGDGLAVLAQVMLVATPLAVLILLALVPEPRTTAVAATSLALRQRMAVVWQNGPFVRLLAAAVLGGIAASVNQALAVFFFVHALRLPSAGAGLLLLYFAAGIAAVPAWVALSRRSSKHRVLCWGVVWACAWFVCMALVPAGAVIPAAVITLMTGLTSAVPQVLGSSIAADVVDLDATRSGEERAALFFSLLAMATKGTIALGPAIALPALQWLGFQPNGTNGPREVAALTAGYCVVPVLIWVCSIVPLWNFPITRERHAALRAHLEATRAGRARG